MTRIIASAVRTSSRLFFLVEVARDSGYPGMRHFDSHAYRTEDEDGVWDFALGSMRTYLIFKEKVAAFNVDKEIQQLLGDLAARGAAPGLGASRTSRTRRLDQGRAVRPRSLMRAKGYAYEKLDQLTVEVAARSALTCPSRCSSGSTSALVV